jgi:hypothetical protein
MVSTCAKLLQWWRYCGFCCTYVPHTYSLSQLLSSHVYWSSHSHPKVAQIDVYTLGLDIWLLLCSQLVPNCLNDVGILEYALHRYPTHIRSPNYCHHMCICQLSSCAKLLQRCWYCWIWSTQVPHTYSVSQLLPSQVHLSSNRHRNSAQIAVYTLGPDIWLLLRCHLVPNCFNDKGILEYVPHRYPTHIRSPNYCHHICFGQQ